MVHFSSVLHLAQQQVGSLSILSMLPCIPCPKTNSSSPQAFLCPLHSISKPENICIPWTSFLLLYLPAMTNLLFTTLPAPSSTIPITPCPQCWYLPCSCVGLPALTWSHRNGTGPQSTYPHFTNPSCTCPFRVFYQEISTISQNTHMKLVIVHLQKICNCPSAMSPTLHTTDTASFRFLSAAASFTPHP